MSTATTVASIAKTVEKTTQWLSELAEKLGRPGDQQYAYRVLRGFLHTLRDRLTVEEAVDLGAQLPELLRGVYYEAWCPSTAPASYYDARTFLQRIGEESLLAGETEAAYATAAAATRAAPTRQRGGARRRRGRPPSPHCGVAHGCRAVILG